jgi:hypothetical protein
MLYAQVNVPIELSLNGSCGTADASGLEVDVVFTGPGGKAWKVPAFWAGDSCFRVRFSPPVPGRYAWHSLCTRPDDGGLHGRGGTLEAAPYTGANPLYQRGRVGVSPDRRTLVHRDGTPFFWLADTWWMGLCKRLAWPMDLRVLVADRAAKGFSVVQIVAGPYPDMAAFDERGANEAGFSWETDWSRVNPSWYDMADLRIEYLVSAGLVPCIVGMWGYYLPQMGMARVKAHWRNLVARYAAWPVVFCLAGEGVMPYYLSEDKERDEAAQRRGWTEAARYVRGLDPYGTLLTIHPTRKGREQVEDPALIDMEMLQTGHGDRQSLKCTLETVVECHAAEPRMPVIVSEVCYEGIGEACRQEVQRLMFWQSVLNGAAGHTYGANGIWQVNTRARPYGPSPHGMAWGNTPWEDAYLLPGSGELGLGKRLLERYRWWKFEPHPEWVDPRWNRDNYSLPSAAGIPCEVRVLYAPQMWEAPTVRCLERDVRYTAFLFDPVGGGERGLGPVSPEADGSWKISVGNTPWNTFPLYQDWVIVLETEGARRKA